VGGTCEQKEYRKNPITNSRLSAKRINQMSNEKMGKKYETATGHPP
jgi:hypothetical protein